MSLTGYLIDCGIPYVEGADINSSDRWDAIGIRRQMHLKCYKEFNLTGSGLFSCPSSGKWIADLRCDSEWKIYEDNIYILQELHLNWQQAKEKCEEYQAYLVEINSKNENIWITEKLVNPFHGKPNRITVFWIGASDIKQEGSFTWSKSKTLLKNTDYTNWNRGEPNDAGRNEDCVLLSLDLKGKWNDFPCKSKLPFVCEKELK
ncbi:perlucin-like protein [Saccostrea echinata]|uniref:perlucin-like protein n=1 Tax=Saccostrea echinata TaxID=191078 RepID=UPI002A7FF047|nr:perlucin-like protein [Saccostrea echinata]